MVVHLEFVVLGPPISNQQNKEKGKANLETWREAVREAAGQKWRKPRTTGRLRAIIVNFYEGGKPSVDVDNMSKPILDSLQGMVYEDDRQIVQAELVHLKIDSAFSIPGVSKVLVTSLQAGKQFVHVRIEDPVDPFPLPK